MKILIAIDGSAPALHAVEWALRQAAEGLKSEFVLVNVQEPASLYEVVTAHDSALIEKVRGAAGADLLRAAEARLEYAGVGFESEVAGGVPEHLIVELAENYGCDAIVMGARGLGDPEGSGLGSVAQAVLGSSPMPVTVVRPSQDAVGSDEA
ncbi:MAG: universal stress protein [Rubrivivax sp.]|nr:universal stress protein [Rubrivivax sp.]MBK7260793.1 universal stress protein [Rubrivivax sp.]MBK8526468.1 universal stress protein [Rubrivivax sp.]